MPKLLLFFQNGDAREVLFDKDRITIGRRSDNDVPLPYPGVSGRHAVISYLSADKCFVEDLKSTNGTLLNGFPVFERQQLKDRDQIDIGGQKFVFLEGRKPVESVKSKDEKKPGEDTQNNKLPAATADVDTSSLSLTAAHEYLSAKPTIPGVPERLITEEELDEEEAISGLHFPTIIKTSDDAPLPPKVTKEPAPLPTLDTDMVPPPSPEDEFPSTSPPQPLEEPTYRPPPPVATLTATAGPNNQRQLLLRYGEYVLGRPGYQLAVIRVGEEGCRLLPMEGERPIELRGQAVPAEGVLLADKDSFTVGRSPLLFELNDSSEPEATPTDSQD